MFCYTILLVAPAASDNSSASFPNSAFVQLCARIMSFQATDFYVYFAVSLSEPLSEGADHHLDDPTSWSERIVPIACEPSCHLASATRCNFQGKTAGFRIRLTMNTCRGLQSSNDKLRRILSCRVVRKTLNMDFARLLTA